MRLQFNKTRNQQLGKIQKLYKYMETKQYTLE